MPALSPNTKRISCSRQQALLFFVYSRPLTPRQDEHSHNSFVQLASPALVTLSTTNVLGDVKPQAGCPWQWPGSNKTLSPWQCSIGGNHCRRNTHENGHQFAGVFVSLVMFAMEHWTKPFLEVSFWSSTNSFHVLENCKTNWDQYQLDCFLQCHQQFHWWPLWQAEY